MKKKGENPAQIDENQTNLLQNGRFFAAGMLDLLHFSQCLEKRGEVAKLS